MSERGGDNQGVGSLRRPPGTVLQCQRQPPTDTPTALIKSASQPQTYSQPACSPLACPPRRPVSEARLAARAWPHRCSALCRLPPRPAPPLQAGRGAGCVRRGGRQAGGARCGGRLAGVLQLRWQRPPAYSRRTGVLLIMLLLTHRRQLPAASQLRRHWGQARPLVPWPAAAAAARRRRPAAAWVGALRACRLLCRYCSCCTPLPGSLGCGLLCVREFGGWGAMRVGNDLH